MSNWLNRLAHLEEEHHRLDKQIDQMIREGRYEDNNIHDLKKQRLQLRDEIAKLKRQHSKEQND
jgi:hypothetical protein